jgi:predicted DNA-binding protein YlxM (UPF0122 family)
VNQNVNLLKPQFQIKSFKMIRKQNLTAQIKSFEELLKDYEEALRLNPKSIAYKGLVKNTREYLAELYEEAELRASQTLTATTPLV